MKNTIVLILLFSLPLIFPGKTAVLEAAPGTTFPADTLPKADAQLYSEPYRPQYHFSPAKGWIGDPCGFVHYQGKYHMFWWGKVESEDLVHYKEITPYAMTGQPEGVSYFTGSVAIDCDNTSGWGTNTWVAAYTVFNRDSKKQSQGISFSNDGKTFHYYDGNPVIDLWSTEFRDPTLFWHAPTARWIMVVAKALEKKVKFYASTDLKQWTWLSDFGPAGAQDRAWECPDLFQVSVDGNPQHKKWVLVVSIDWAKEQYFVGDFDGTAFRLVEGHPSHPLYVDHGLDFYASRTFRDYDNTLSAPVSIGWVATWDYAQQAPSTWGKGFWSIPREYALKSYPEGLRLVQAPIRRLESLRYDPVVVKRTLPAGVHTLPQFMPRENVYELDVTFSTETSNTFGLNLCVGEGRKVTISYNTDSRYLVIDRTHCSAEPIEKFARMTFAEVTPVNGRIRMHIYVDRSSVELFTNEGKEVFTLLTYPSGTQTGVEVFALKKGTSMNFKAWKLKSIWK